MVYFPYDIQSNGGFAMKLRIITDSASDLIPPYRPGLTVLPLTVLFGERAYQDGVDLDHKQFYELLIESDALPTTSQPTPAQFEDAFRTAVEAGETVVCVTLSSKLSGTYQSACIAAEEFAPGQVYVVDSLNASIGQAILVQRAFQLADQGLDAPAIVKALETERGQVRLVALLDTLEYLKRGGRLSASAALVGGLLGIKPVIAIEDGQVKVLGKARGSKNGNNLLMEEVGKAGGIDFDRPYCLGYTGLSDDILQKYIADSKRLWAGRVGELPISTIGSAIGTHIGPGAIGVVFFQLEQDA